MQDDATNPPALRPSIATTEPLTPDSLRNFAQLLVYVTDFGGRYLWNDLLDHHGPNADEVRRHALSARHALRDADPHLQHAISELLEAAKAADEVPS